MSSINDRDITDRQYGFFSYKDLDYIPKLQQEVFPKVKVTEKMLVKVEERIQHLDKYAKLSIKPENKSLKTRPLDYEFEKMNNLKIFALNVD